MHFKIYRKLLYTVLKSFENKTNKKTTTPKSVLLILQHGIKVKGCASLTRCVSGLSGAPAPQPQGRAIPARGGRAGLLAGEARRWSGGGRHRQRLGRQGDLPKLMS